jgi:hypothetical protein
MCVLLLCNVSLFYMGKTVCKRGGCQAIVLNVVSSGLPPSDHFLRSDALVPEAINNHVIISNTTSE